MPLTAISAPGKVLLAGGYLAVDRDYTGLVLGLSARIHVLVAAVAVSKGVQINEISVKSPQFIGAEWVYGYRLVEDDGGIRVVQLQGNSSDENPRNKFVETALTFALTYVSTYTAAAITPVNINILADDDYYSQAKTSSKCANNSNSRFQNFNVSIGDAHKTGLGSSAALVTSFTASVLAHYIPECRENPGSDIWRQRIHNLAQAAHCTAQGKIGSGFDVAAAVFGSCIYKRFSPSILENVGSAGSKGFSSRLQGIVEDNEKVKLWDAQIDPSLVSMPSSLRLVMCDVDCGSETPGMVKKVFAWKNEKPEEALPLWTTLQGANEDLAVELSRLSKDQSQSYEKLSSIILNIRSLIRDMSEKAGVPIEPLVQTQLIDSCSALPGVVGGVVPGAGGYDALALLIENDEKVLDRLQRHLSMYETNETQVGQKIGDVRLLSARQEMKGLVYEHKDTYIGWI